VNKPLEIAYELHFYGNALCVVLDKCYLLARFLNEQGESFDILLSHWIAFT